MGDFRRRCDDAGDGDRGSAGGGGVSSRRAGARHAAAHGAVAVGILGGASVLWPYGTSFFSEAFLAAAFVWAAALLIEARTAANPARHVAIAALLIVVAGLTKVTSLIVAPAFVVAVLAERSIAMPRRLRVAVVIGGAILLAGALQLGWNAYRFGSPFDLGYDWSETIPVMPPRAFAIGDIPRGLAVLLFSPGKSLFVWAPILVIALLNASATWRRDRALSIGFATAAAIGLLAYAAYLFPKAATRTDRGTSCRSCRCWRWRRRARRRARTGRRGSTRAPPWVSSWRCMATRVSYLEDQALRRDQTGRTVPNYYEEIVPAPGRPNNRYRLEHIPFVTAMKIARLVGVADPRTGARLLLQAPAAGAPATPGRPVDS